MKLERIYPFKFLDSYNENDTDIFFGREEEIDELYKMVFQSNVIFIYGASGTGKTSLINCGLVKKFQSHERFTINIRRGNNIIESLSKQLEKIIEDIKGENSKESEEEPTWLTELMRRDHLSYEELGTLEKSFRTIYLNFFRPIYLVFDQFEELYILGNKAEQEEFIKTVQKILRIEQPVKMMFSIREEYLGYLFEFEKAVPKLLRKKLRVEPMNYEKVSQVIEGATNNENSIISLNQKENNEVIKEIFEKVKGAQKTLTVELPYLQVFLDKLYMKITKDEDRQKYAEFNLEEIEKMGDIGDVLREFLEEQVNSISNKLIGEGYVEANIENIWKILSPFATPEGTKEPISMENLKKGFQNLQTGLIEKVITEFENKRIVKKSEREETYEIAHDSLAQRIMERRSNEDNTLLEIARLIKSQVSLKGGARGLFTKEQLTYIDPFLPKLREQKSIDQDTENLILESWKKINDDMEMVLKYEFEKGRALKEIEGRKEAEVLKEMALNSEKNAKKKTFYATLAAIIGAITAVIAVYYYFDAANTSNKLEKTLGSLKITLDSLTITTNLVKREQILSKAKELMIYGDSYKRSGEVAMACENYRAGFNSLINYQHDSLYQKLKEKIEECK